MHGYGIHIEIELILAFAAFLFFAWHDKLPSIDTITHWVELINTKGGNIFLLLLVTVAGAVSSIRLFYYLIGLSVDHKLEPRDVIAIMAITFITGTITGNFQGALLKTMNGDTTTNAATNTQPAGRVQPTPSTPPQNPEHNPSGNKSVEAS